MGILIQHGTVINADASVQADVLIEGDTIAQVAAHIDPTGHMLVEAAGLLVMPGGINVHTPLDMIFGGTTSADDYLTGSLSVVSTDHCPFRFADQKSLGKNGFTKIPNGGLGY